MLWGLRGFRRPLPVLGEKRVLFKVAPGRWNVEKGDTEGLWILTPKQTPGAQMGISRGREQHEPDFRLGPQVKGLGLSGGGEGGTAARSVIVSWWHLNGVARGVTQSQAHTSRAISPLALTGHTDPPPRSPNILRASRMG